MRLLLKAVLTAGLLVCGMGRIDASELTRDSLAVIKKNVETGKAVLVDVREQSEWDAGHIEGAIFLPLSSLQGDLDAGQFGKKLPKDKILYTHCVVGKRSVTAGNRLETLGFKVRPIKPGYKELVKAGFKKAAS